MILSTICARGGSKGIPKKNLVEVNGLPLIAHTIKQALSVPQIDRVIVSTDCQEIADVSRSFGAEVPFMRPNELSTDDCPKLPVIKHALDWVRSQGQNPKIIVDLQPTSPMRNHDDIVNCINLIGDADGVITAFKSNRNPYFNMVEINQEGFANLSKRSGNFATRQSCPPVFAMNGSIYVWKTDFFDSCQSVISGNLRVYEMPEERSIDIDCEFDLQLVRFLTA